MPQSHITFSTFRSSATGAMMLQLPLEIDASIVVTPCSCTRRRYSDSSLSPPMPSSTKVGAIFTPPMPPAAFISSISSSAAALPGTPNTDAAPDVKVVMPIFSSAGFVCAQTHAVASVASNSVAKRFIVSVSLVVM